MPSFNRRGFLQLLGVAGVAPLIPALPARAAATGGSVSTSKALWASLHATAGSTGKFVNLAKGMGLSNATIQGVSARSIGVKIALATAPNALTKAGRPKLGLPSVSKSKPLKVSQNIKRTLKRAILTDTDDETQAADITEDHPLNDAVPPSAKPTPDDTKA